MSDIYKKNMRCARDNTPQIIKIVSKATILPSLEATLSIVPTIEASEQAKYIVEQEYAAKKVSLEKNIFGFVFCLDYYIMRELIRKYSWYTKLFFVFPSADYFKTLLHYYDFTELIKSPSFMPFAFNDPLELSNNIKHNLTLFDFYNNGLQFFEYHPYRILFPEIVQSTSKHAREISFFAAANINTTLVWGNDVIINNIKNMSSVIKYPDASIVSKIWTGKPIICVAAGPSLSKNIEYLKKIQNEVLIIAVSAALKPLIAHGIKPDMITMLDMLEEGQLYLEDMDLSDIYTVKDMSCYHGIVKNHQSKFIFATSAMQSTALIHGILNKLGIFIEEKYIFRGTMTVANLSILLAHSMGANKIILLGQDLAYTDITHVKGSRFAHPTTITEYNGEKIIEYKTFDNADTTIMRLVPAKGYWGDKVWTTDQFITYREFMEHLINSYKLDIVNSTEGGSYIEGAEHITLKDAYKKYIKPYKLDSKELNIPLTRENYNFEALPTSIEALNELIKEYTIMRDDAIEMVGVVEKDTGERTKAKTEEYERLINDFLIKYPQKVDSLGQIGHAGQILFRRIMNANTSQYSEADKMADSRNKVVLLCSAIIETSGMIIRELDELVIELKTMC